MKKIIIVFLAILMTLYFIPTVSANDAAMPGLIITETLRNPSGKDVYEGFEIMNASRSAIDLYDYMIYYAKNNNISANENIKPEDVTKYCYLAYEKGKVMLDPGEIAMVWVVYSDTYKSLDETYGNFVKDLGNGAVEYNFDAYRNYMKTDSGKTLDPSIKVLVADKTDGKYYETGKTVAWGFNMENSDAVRLWVCPRGGTTADATCIVDTTNGNAGEAVSYEPSASGIVMLQTDSIEYTPGVLDAKQEKLSEILDAIKSGKPYETEAVTTDETTLSESEATTEATTEDTAGMTTEATTEDTVATTVSTIPTESTEPTNPDTDDGSGCAGFIGLGGAALGIIAVLGCVLVIKRK